jgi:serine/threonine-protein kinase RsbW
VSDWRNDGLWPTRTGTARTEPDTADAMIQGELVELRVNADLESLALVRTMASAVAMRGDYDIDAIADLRLVADEICTTLIRRATPGSRLLGRFSLLPRSLTFTVSVPVRDVSPLRQDSLSWRLLTALVDSIGTTVRVDEPGPELVIEVLMTRKAAEL